MTRRIAIIQGHPDPRGNHFGHALAEAYAQGAATAGHKLQRIEVAQLEFPLLRTKEEFETGTVPESVREAQEAIRQADHLVILYPLWLGGMPALLQAFLEQVFRHGFAMTTEDRGRPKKLLKGKSARIVITMGMPALLFRWYFGAHSLKSLRRNILAFSGIGPIRTSLIGMVEGSDARRRKWLETMRALGRDGR
ncbi:MAG: NAD(P)H-dependent oxidoreductase [Bacteroidota bacterium]